MHLVKFPISMNYLFTTKIIWEFIAFAVAFIGLQFAKHIFGNPLHFIKCHFLWITYLQKDMFLSLPIEPCICFFIMSPYLMPLSEIKTKMNQNTAQTQCHTSKRPNNQTRKQPNTEHMYICIFGPWAMAHSIWSQSSHHMRSVSFYHNVAPLSMTMIQWMNPRVSTTLWKYVVVRALRPQAGSRWQGHSLCAWSCQGFRFL